MYLSKPQLLFSVFVTISTISLEIFELKINYPEVMVPTNNL